MAISNQERNYYLFVTDCTLAPRVHSPTLSDRGIVYYPNPVTGNKPITIGHKYSIMGFLPPKANKAPPWILPLMTKRVSTDSKDTEIGAEQLQATLNKLSCELLCVSVVDSGYCSPEYIDKLHNTNVNNNNLVTIVRARSNRILWRRSENKRSPYVRRGHELWYGSKFDFKDEDTWHTPDKLFQEEITTKKGKMRLVSVQSWDNMLMRQKRGIHMNKNPCTVYKIKITDIKGNQVFNKPLWLMVFGDRRNELSPKQVYRDYFQRYDIEHFFKFAKNHLLVDKLQTPKTEHEENWWKICSIAYCILFAARLVADKIPHPWEKYLPEYNRSNIMATPTQVQRAFSKITCKIGTPAITPKPRGKPLGRSLGALQTKRKRHLLIIKSQSTPKEVASG